MRRIACLLVVGLAALAVPASAFAAHTYTSVSGSAAGSNGYVVTWSASTNKLGVTPVTLQITFIKGGGTLGKAGWWQQIQNYMFSLPKNALKFDKKLAKGSLKGSLGQYGKLKIKFKGKGRNAITKPAKTCTGPNTQSRSVTIKGSITFDPAGPGKVGKLKKKGTGSRQTSNKAFHCHPGTNSTCFIKNGQESFSSISFGSSYLSFSASRARAGAVVFESMSTSSPLSKPGLTVNRSIYVAGAPTVLSETGTAPGTATVTGAGHGITGTMTITNALTSRADLAPCASFTVDAISGFGSPQVGGALTAHFDGAPATIDPAAAGASVSSSWNRDHT